MKKHDLIQNSYNMQTIIDLFESSVRKYSDNPFMWEKSNGEYKPTSYKETFDKAQIMAAGLIELGIKEKEHLALLSEGRNDWIVSELGILYAGAVNIPLSIKLESNEILFRLNHSESKCLIVSNRQAGKIEKIKEHFSHIEKIIYIDGCDYEDEKNISLKTLLENGKSFLSKYPEIIKERKSNITGKTWANITYTSGTTSDPKGIILTHRNYTANVDQAYSLMDIPETYKTLLILPLDHCFAHVAGIYSFMGKGASLAMVEQGKTPLQTLKNIPKNIQETKPDLLLSVPALAKNFKKNIDSGIKEKGKITYGLYKAALNNAYKYNKEGHNKGNGLNALRGPVNALFDVILFKKIRKFFGGNLKFFIGGGALLDIELQKYFYAIGIPMMQGYGLSEATPIISSNALHKHKLGSSGFLVNNLDLKICDDNGNEVPMGQKGEIVVKGENVMYGYWKNEKATKETIKEGWLHTGDMGYIDKDNFLYVLGRFKSLLISNDGEKYSPESIEEALTEKTNFIDQVVLHNNQNPYTIALVVPNFEAIKSTLKSNDINIESEDGKSEALKLIQSEINNFRKGGRYEGEFPERWLPAAVAVLEDSFNEENKMMNSTMKIVRGKVTDFYRERIDYLYKKDGKNIVNEINLKALGKIAKN